MRFLFTAAILLTAPLTGQTPLCSQLQTLTQNSPSHWGISVTTLTGGPLCQINAGQLFRPASNNKLFTTSAALALLGPGQTFETKVTGNFDPVTGAVTGDLTLVGGGDANLDSGDLPYQPNRSETNAPFAFHDLEDLAAQLVAKGVKSIAGDIIGDDTLFPYEPYPTAWEQDDLAWGFGAPISALTIADNQLPLTITPAKLAPGQSAAATVTLDQHGVPYYTVVSEVTTVRAKEHLPGIEIEHLPGTRILRVYGTIAEDAHPGHAQVAIDDPAAYAAMAFRQILLGHGIAVTGTARPQHQLAHEAAGFLAQVRAPGGSEDLTVAGGEGGGNCMTPLSPPTLATHTSAPLAQDIVFLLKTSQNLHAELLLHALGRRIFCGSGSTVAGARMIRAFLLHAGIAPGDFVLYDGSGLSGRDLVTPRSLTQLLGYAATEPWFPQLKSALPIAGTDGTLANRFTGQNQAELKGKVFAKTGTLGETRTLSGFLTAASGRTLVFSILDDNHPPDSPADATLMDRIVALIAAAN